MDKFVIRGNKEQPEILDLETKKLSEGQNDRRKQKFSLNWLEDKDLKSWIKQVEGDNFKAFCSVCGRTLQLSGGLPVLRGHAASKIHLKNSASLLRQPSLEQNIEKTNLQLQVKNAEFQIATFAVEHNIAFSSLDHLCELIKNVGNNTAVSKKISCNRTKATAITKNVIGAGHLEVLIRLIRENKFSICADESTDLSAAKHLCIVARVFTNGQVFDFFLALLRVTRCDAQTLYECIKGFFSEKNINYKANLIGFAADGANVMTGSNHSVAALLKKDCPNLVIFKCLCHSLALCANYAVSKLPDEIESTLREVYSYIQNSPQKIGELHIIAGILEIKPYKLLHPSATRWLSLECVVKRFIVLLEPLKIYFGVLVNRCGIKSAEKHLILIAKPEFEIYLHFMAYNLGHINTLNRLYQSEQPNITNVYFEMERYIKLVLDYYIKPDYLKLLELKNIDFHCETFYKDDIYFPIEVRRLIDKLEFNTEILADIKRKCLDFYVELTHQIYKRFDFQSKLFKNLAIINPKNVVVLKFQSVFPLVEHFPNLVSISDIQELDDEWREIRQLDFTNRVNMNDEEFWLNISKITKGDNTPAFPKLPKFVFHILSLPHSSANVERMFSAININKTKTRNRLSDDTISGILYTKDFLRLNNFKCFNVEGNKEMYSLFNQNMYDFKVKEV